MSDELRADVESLVINSPWYGTATNNIEERTGAVNISTIGRDCTDEQRKTYYEWDKDNKEREKIVSILSFKYPHIHFLAGGEISIDIYPSGLKNVCKILDIELDHHDALSDARASAKITIRALKDGLSI